MLVNQLFFSRLCSTFAANAFMITYLVMAAITIVNMFVAVILENYSQATEDVTVKFVNAKLP